MSLPKRVRRARLNHAVRRSQERYGLDLSQCQLQEISKAIKRGECINLGNAQWLVKWEGVWLRVVKIRKSKLPLTFLPITAGIQKIIANAQSEARTRSEPTPATGPAQIERPTEHTSPSEPNVVEVE